jgi:hypothetical protein
MNNERKAAVLQYRAQWLANAKQQLAETKEEIALFEQGDFAWERKFNMRFPGSGYAATMRAQAARLTMEIERHERADAESLAYRNSVNGGES